LFGHEKGSFTGAVRQHRGFFKRAEAGTLFLDELTEMPLELQPHFLRVLETGRILPVGSEREVAVDTRIVAATNRDPRQAIGDKALREDLYFRLNVFPLLIPPLRERSSDVPLLAEHFVAQFRNGADGPGFSASTLDRLGRYHWPGNVRELRHVVQRALIMAPADADELQMPERFESPFGGNGGARGLEAGRSIRDVERDLIEKTLEHFDGDKKAAAETLGISLNTLYNRLNSYQEAD
jgi:DNA-binding NtrC family response regulator